MPRTIKLRSSIVLYVLAALSLGFALLMTLATVLAGMGILADVGPDENQAMAREAAVYCGIAYAIGLALLTAAILTMKSYRKNPSQHKPDLCPPKAANPTLAALPLSCTQRQNVHDDGIAN